MNLIELNCMFFGHGFGINTNILETNVINLAVVIAVVVTFVGDAVRELLENRKKKFYKIYVQLMLALKKSRKKWIKQFHN